MLQVLEKSYTQNGVEIQLENWGGSLAIGAYPIAKNNSYWIKGGEKFRLTISENKYRDYTNDNVKNDFEALKRGDKTLDDLAPYFWNGEKDMHYLGMI